MEFLQQLVNGLQLGSIYALIALGYTMVYGIVKLINFAHGDVYMVGAYTGYMVTGFLVARGYGKSFAAALLVAMVICSALGILIERVAYRPLRAAPRLAALTTAIGVSLFLENFVRMFVGPNFLAFPELFRTRTYNVYGLQVSNVTLIVLGVSIALMLMLRFIVQKTRIGKAMRAVSLDKDTARLMGINVDYVISVTFALGSALAGAAGVLVGVAYPRIDPYMGILPGLKAFVAAVLGGIGSIPGAMVGGMIMGIAELMVIGFLSSTYRDAIAFVILILILLVRPSGILGQYVGEKV